MRGATASENKVKSRNETLNVTSILEDPRDALLYDIQPDGSNVKATSCPEIEVTLENTVVNALIDTGSEITCISEEFYYANQNDFAT